MTEGERLRLPWHRADKKVRHIGADGSKWSPPVPNAVKLESFIFDALPLADKTMILEGQARGAVRSNQEQGGRGLGFELQGDACGA